MNGRAHGSWKRCLKTQLQQLELQCVSDQSAWEKGRLDRDKWTKADGAKKQELFQLDCPIYNFKNYMNDVHGIRFPVPEKEFHYWMGRWFFE